MPASDFVVVLVTTGGADEAENLAEAIVGERLAACVNVIGPVRSIYRWHGVVERAEEHLMMIKTRVDLFEDLAARVRELHSYENPEIVALPIASGSAAYLDWLLESTKGA